MTKYSPLSFPSGISRLDGPGLILSSAICVSACHVRYPRALWVTESARLCVTQRVYDNMGQRRIRQGKAGGYSRQDVRYCQATTCCEQGLQNRGLGVRVPPLLPVKQAGKTGDFAALIAALCRQYPIWG
jgi:hypothetical protein